MIIIKKQQGGENKNNCLCFVKEGSFIYNAGLKVIIADPLIDDYTVLGVYTEERASEVVEEIGRHIRMNYAQEQMNGRETRRCCDLDESNRIMGILSDSAIFTMPEE